MNIRRVRALLGPNLWADFPMVEVWCDLSGPPPADWPDAAAALRAGLLAALPGIEVPRCPPADAADPLCDQRHRRWLARVLLATVLHLHACTDARPGFVRLRRTSQPGVYRFAYQRVGHLPAAACPDAALELVRSLLAGETPDAQAEIERLRLCAREAAPTPSCAALMQAAGGRGIPARALPGGVLQLGHGARQRRLPCTVPATAVAERATVDRALLGALLAAAGLACTPEPVGSAHFRLLVAGRRVLAALRWQPGPGGNGSGPRVTDVTGLVHGEVRSRVVDAVRALGLDTAEVRLAVGDVTRSLESQGGLVSDVIPSPPLDLYVAAVHSRPFAAAFLETLYRPGETGRIPIAAVTGTNGKTTVTRLIAHGLAVSGRFVGMTCTDGIYLADRCIDADDCAGPQSARTVLLNPQVEAAVLETARGGILREGLGFDACDVGVVTNIGEGDHLGLAGVDTLAELAAVKATLVRGVAPGGTAVLNAQDPLVARMAAACKGRVLYFACDPAHPTIQRHRRAGGSAVFVRGGDLILAEGLAADAAAAGAERVLIDLDQVPLTGGGRIRFQVENCLAAAGALWALGLAPETIAAALETFGADLDKSPGRFNVLAINGATVVFDYGHNPSALLAMIEALESFPHRRRLAVYSAAGDRRDIDLIRQGEILGAAFDRVILYEDHSVRGRPPGEIMALFARGLASGRRVQEVQSIHGWQAAVEAVLWVAEPGDLVLVQADVIDETVDYLRTRLAEFQARAHPPVLHPLPALAEIPTLSAPVLPITLPVPSSHIQAGLRPASGG